MSLYIKTIGHGPELVMIHGWGMHGGIWAPLVESLSASFRLHLVDLPGLGHSRSITPYTLENLSETVAQAMPDKVAVCGWSLGAQLALRWAMKKPEQISRLILVCATPKFVNAEDWNLGVEDNIFQTFAAQVQQDYQATLSKFLALQACGGDTPKENIRYLRAQFFQREIPKQETLQASLEILLQTDLRMEIKQICTPSLVLHGDRDKLVPLAAGRWMSENLPMARFQVCYGASHMPFLSHTEWFVENLRLFLSEQYR